MLTRLFIAVLIISAISYAGSTLSLTSAVDQSGNSNLEAKIAFDQYFGKELSLYVSGDVESVTARDGSGLVLPVTHEQSGNFTRITVLVPTDYVEFDIITPYLTSKSGSEWEYELTVKLSEDVNNFSSVLLLPSGAKISATNGAVGTDGAGLAVSWAAGSFDASKKATMFANYTIGPEGFDTTMVVSLVALFVVGVLTYFYLARNKTKQPEKLEVLRQPQDDKLEKLELHAVFKTLEENEKEIVRELMRQDGKTTQAHLYLYTHIPKATLSRRLASLESKGIIISSQKGVRKLISLTDVFK